MLIMKMTFRWYGDKDSIAISKIAQIPVIDGIVSAVYDVPAGEVWPEASIKKLKDQAESCNLKFEVVESVPVHEDIKLRAAGCDRLIDNYCENIRRLSKYGIKVICYNFMPVFDWLRSEMARPLADGSNSLAYDEKTVLSLNPLTSNLSLPGWDESYTKAQLVELLNRYRDVDEEKLWSNLEYFLKKIIPVCEECDIKMAIHPDDPPWGIFGLPRIITDQKNLRRFLELVPSVYNGVTFCTGSFGAGQNNNLIEMIKLAQGRIHFAHIRNIRYTGERSFQESAHPTVCGSLDIFNIVKTLVETGFDGYVRPDHGRMIWGETGKYGYGLYDRALGAMYLYGLFEAIQKQRGEPHHDV
jgi:mannonate dehydratase